MLTSMTVDRFLDELASQSAAPGGGSVSALSASLGSALTAMVCRLTVGKKKYAEVESDIQSVLSAIEKIRPQFTSLIDKDTDAFNNVMMAFALPKESDEQKTIRQEAIESATKKATMIPLRVMELCEEAMGLSRIAVGKGNTNAVSDAGVSALMISAGCRGAYYNVRINLGSIKDAHFKQEISQKAEAILHSVASHAEAIGKSVETRF